MKLKTIILIHKLLIVLFVIVMIIGMSLINDDTILGFIMSFSGIFLAPILGLVVTSLKKN